MKLKDLKGFPKEKERNDWHCSRQGYENPIILDRGYNQAHSEIGEIELVVDEGKIDEGLLRTIKKAIKKWEHRDWDNEIFCADGENLGDYLASYLKKEGYVKLPGKYVVKKGCLVKID